MKASPDFGVPSARASRLTVPGRSTSAVLLLAALGMCVALGGCSTPPKTPLALEVKYKPSNIFYKAKTLDPQIKRVAILPLATSVPSESLQAGIDLFQPIFASELDKTKRFDLAILSATELRQLTGRPSWKVNDQLPSDFFERIHEATGCDAVFFPELTRYSAYPPLAVGWKLTLIQNNPHEILWQADEVFDAGDASVAAAARQYSSEHIHVEAPLSDPESILGAPSRFGQYSLHALLSLLPLR